MQFERLWQKYDVRTTLRGNTENTAQFKARKGLESESRHLHLSRNLPVDRVHVSRQCDHGFALDEQLEDHL
jgi:hypothetical protein